MTVDVERTTDQMRKAFACLLRELSTQGDGSEES